MPDDATEPFTPLTPLERLLVTAALDPDDEAAGQRLAAAILEEMIGVPGHVDPEVEAAAGGETGGDTGRSGFTPMILTDRAGQQMACAFTTPSRFAAFGRAVGEQNVGDLEIRGTTGRELFSRLVESNIPLVLNPHNGFGKHFHVAEMSDRLAGHEPAARERVITHRTELLVGQPAHVPAGLVERLTAYLSGLGGIERATLVWVQYPDGLQAYLLGLRTSLSREQVLPGIEGVIGDLDGRVLDVALAAPGEPLVTDDQPPFLGGDPTAPR